VLLNNFKEKIMSPKRRRMLRLKARQTKQDIINISATAEPEIENPSEFPTVKRKRKVTKSKTKKKSKQ
tara:strand:+ start:359 stop:562 length:204 start_codon:yes stop_codon:yes gene_type:complete